MDLSTIRGRGKQKVIRYEYINLFVGHVHLFKSLEEWCVEIFPKTHNKISLHQQYFQRLVGLRNFMKAWIIKPFEASFLNEFNMFLWSPN